MAAVGRHHRRSAAAEGRATFVVAMNRVDVVDLVVDLVDVDLDVDLVDVVSLSSSCILFSGLLAPGCIFAFFPWQYFCLLASSCSGDFFPGCFWGFPVILWVFLDVI